KLTHLPTLLVLNNCDTVGKAAEISLCKRFSAIPISAQNQYNIDTLMTLTWEKLAETPKKGELHFS
ncbi:MAG: hypothetical protein ACE5FU_11030, partial [Nitrospinota bacterium]